MRLRQCFVDNCNLMVNISPYYDSFRRQTLTAEALLHDALDRWYGSHAHSLASTVPFAAGSCSSLGEDVSTVARKPRGRSALTSYGHERGHTSKTGSCRPSQTGRRNALSCVHEPGPTIRSMWRKRRSHVSRRRGTGRCLLSSFGQTISIGLSAPGQAR